MNVLERWGLYHINRYLEVSNFVFRCLPLQYVTKIAVLVSFFIGFGITLLVAMAEMMFFANFQEVFTSPRLIFLFVTLNFGLIAIEFWLLFHIGFQVVARYIMFIEKKQCIDEKMRSSLVRAILEINEPNIECFGLNPYRKKHKHYWIQLLFYKTKVILSNFVGKLIARKILSRLGLRSYAPFISTIITGWWDAWIQGSVLKEVRFRLASRLYVISLLKSIDAHSAMNNTMEALIRLIAVRIELFEQYNINLDYMLTEIDRKIIGSVADLNDLFDIQQLESVYITLSSSEKSNLIHIAQFLFAFKRKNLSKEEEQMLSIFHLKPEIIEHTKKQFDQLFKNKNIDLLMEI